MDAAQSSRRIRVSFIAMLVLGLALNFTRASAWLGPDGAPAPDPDFETLTYVGWAQVGVNVLGWLVVLLGVRALARRNEGGGPLTVTLWCWGIALVLDFAWIGVPFLAADTDIAAVMPWFGRADTALVVAGAVASLLYARDADATPTVLGASAVGLLVYVAVVLSQEVDGLLRFDWFWGAYILSAFARIGLLGSMAILPWASIGQADLPAGATKQTHPGEGSATTDFAIGGLFLVGGVAVTYLSWTGGGIGGRTVLAWGPIVYGLYRIIRGLGR